MKKILSLILLIAILFGITPIVYADASSNVTLTVDKTTVNVGDTVTLTFKVAQKVQALDFSINYLKDVFEYVSSEPETTNKEQLYIDDDKGNYVQVGTVNPYGFDTFFFTFKAKAKGNATFSTNIDQISIDTNESLPYENKSVNVTVQEAPTTVEVTSVILDKTTASVEVGKTTTLTATVKPDNATNKTVTWTSSDTSIATVSNGTVTGVKAGTATITAKAGTKSATSTVTVTAASNGGTTDEDKKPDNPPIDDGLTWTDASNVTFKFERYGTTSNQKIIIDGLNYDKKANYYYYLSNNKEDKPQNSEYTELGASNNKYSIGWNDKIKKVLERNGDIHIWLLEKKQDSNFENHYKVLVNAKKIERIEQLSLGSRIGSLFTSFDTSIHVSEIVASDGRKVKYKIGKVEDVKILNSIKNSEKDCLTTLMNYAKSAKNGKTGLLNIGKSNSITSSLGLIDNNYYYVYYELDDENGKYYPIEDISLYQARYSKGNSFGDGWWLYDYLSSDFKWNLGDDGSGSTTTDGNKDNTTSTKPIPQTGETLTVAGIIIGTISVATMSIIKYRKYRDI